MLRALCCIAVRQLPALHVAPAETARETEYLLGVTASYAKLSDLEARKIGNWTRESVHRANVLLPAHLGARVLTLLESSLQCRLRPRYECFQSQLA